MVNGKSARRACAVFAFTFSFSIVTATPSIAQQAPLQSRTVEVQVDSGIVKYDASAIVAGNDLPAPGQVPGAVVVFSELVRVDDGQWLRLQFDHVQLAGSLADATGSFLRMTSLQDGAHQVLNEVSVSQWRNTSAYFNGGSVLVELLAYPASEPGDNQVIISSVLTSDGDDSFETSICDGVDLRELSNSPRDARSLPGGCTSWLFNNRHYCLLTAGHCSGSTNDVVEFNVPLQAANGGWVFAHPDDQYAIDMSSKQTLDNPCVNDWSYFGAFPNSNTGLTMLQAQGESYQLADAAPPVSGQQIQIRGYGTTSAPVPPPWNRAQKVHSGPFTQSSGTTIRYRVDTTGGNSGSAVLDLTTNQVIGIHTCGGCGGSGGSNVGTAIHHPALQSALANPQGVCAWAPPGPANNTCETTILITDGVTMFDNVDATTDGPDEPEHCDFFGDTSIQSDVWFGYMAECDGVLTVGLCESEFSAKLGIYAFPCPTQPGEIIACNAGACGTRAELTIAVSKGEAFRFRVGGHDGSQGQGVLTVTCTPLTPCAGDLDDDGHVDVSDLLMLLGDWGPCATCDGDLNSDGMVDVADLLELLGAWGPCD